MINELCKAATWESCAPEEEVESGTRLAIDLEADFILRVLMGLAAAALHREPKTEGLWVSDAGWIAVWTRNDMILPLVTRCKYMGPGSTTR